MSAPMTSDCNQDAARAHGSSLQRLVMLRRSWFLPQWSGLSYGETPSEHPRLKYDFSGILNFSTRWELRKPEPALSRVARDLMRRLARELPCDGPPIDESSEGEAWLEIRNREPIGCATICMEHEERWMLGAWVMPAHRRTGVMKRLWDEITDKYGVLKIIRPSPAMRGWMQKHNVRVSDSPEETP